VVVLKEFLSEVKARKVAGMDEVIVDEDAELLTRLRAGDEEAFMTLVDKYGPLMLRIALTHVRTRAVAEDVVQEAWLGVLQGLDRFEGRSSLKTWILRIVANRARTRGEREARSVPLSSLGGGRDDIEDEPAVDPERFLPRDHPTYPGAWAIPPHSWARLPEERLLASETLQQVRAAIAKLPPRQQEVITLRDVEGWEPDEVSAALDLTPGNQRVLLHRARSKVRAELEHYFDEVEP
jgi:RNA polymerase sigma-70 factor (ECF subfamily)